MVLFEGLVDGVGDSSFDDAKCFEVAVALFFPSLKWCFGSGVAADLNYRDGVYCCVELAVSHPTDTVVAVIS